MSRYYSYNRKKELKYPEPQSNEGGYNQSSEGGYIHSKGRRYSGYAGWIMAILFSALLNITLFGLMPGLIQRVPQMPDSLDIIKAVHMVRISRQPEEHHEKKKLKKPDSDPEPLQPRKKIPPKIVKPLSSQSSQSVRLKPRLSFDLNPALPKLSTSLEMPPLEHFTMEIDAPAVVEVPVAFTPPALSIPSAPPVVPVPPSPEASDISGTLKIAPLKDQYGMGELDSPLIPLVKIPPMYPMRAKRRGIEGWVKIRFQVDRKGRVDFPEVVESEPERVFDSSVIKCVKRWKFKPGIVQGRAVNTLVETTIRFKLEK